MKIAVARERGPRETRVAATPDSVKRLRALDFTVVVETGAGVSAGYDDEQYRQAGAEVHAGAAEALRGAGALLSVGRPDGEVAECLGEGSMLIGMLDPYRDRAGIEALARRGVIAVAMELMPRISRAQSMDVLSSQSNLAGYCAVIEAASHLPRAMPMMMTAAGTIAPARLFVIGAGVAGLQAIATGRRLGAVVSATDVRPAVKEQVESLGADFVMVESDEVGESEDGYAREMSEDHRRRQRELVARHVTRQDIVITTALVPGRPAPRLLTARMVESMRPGSVVVDLATEQGGNCEVSRPDEVVIHAGVGIIGHTCMACRVPADASSMYARNLLSFVSSMCGQGNGELHLDWDDELLAGTALTRDGALVHPVLLHNGDGT